MKKTLMGITALAISGLVMTGIATGAPDPGDNASLKDTKIVLQTDPAFHGLIESSSKVCLDGRIIKVLKRKDGRDKIIGGAKTDPEGLYSVPEPNVRPGTYYAKVRRYNPDGGQACAGDRSNKIIVGK